MLLSNRDEWGSIFEVRTENTDALLAAYMRVWHVRPHLALRVLSINYSKSLIPSPFTISSCAIYASRDKVTLEPLTNDADRQNEARIFQTFDLYFLLIVAAWTSKCAAFMVSKKRSKNVFVCFSAARTSSRSFHVVPRTPYGCERDIQVSDEMFPRYAGVSAYSSRTHSRRASPAAVIWMWDN